MNRLTYMLFFVLAILIGPSCLESVKRSEPEQATPGDQVRPESEERLTPLAFPSWLENQAMPPLEEEPALIIDTGGHQATIRDVMFTSDGKYLLSVSDDKTIRIWSVLTGECIRVLRGQSGEGRYGKIYAAALSPDDRVLAVGGFMARGFGVEAYKVGTIRLIDLRTGEVRGLLRGHENVIYDLAFSQDGTRLISGNSDNTARIWDIRSGESLHMLKGHTARIFAVGFSPDGRRAATGSFDHSVKLWDATNGSLIKTLDGHTGHVRRVAFTPDGKHLLSGGRDRTIRLWNGHTGAFLKVLAEQKTDLFSFAVSPDGTRVLTGCMGAPNISNVFAIPSGRPISSFTKHSNSVFAAAISPTGKTAATAGGNENDIYLWELSTGQPKHKLSGKGKRVWNVGFAKDGRSIAWGNRWRSPSLFAHGPLNQAFQIKAEEEDAFDLAMGEELKNDGDYLRGIRSVGTLNLETEGNSLHPTLRIMKEGELAYEVTRDSTDGYNHHSLTLTPDGKTVISGAGCDVVSAYDPDTGEKIREFVGHTAAVWGVAPSPDNRLLVTGSGDQTVRLWEIETGKLLLSIFQGMDNEWVAWIPEGYHACSLNGAKYIGWHINRGDGHSALYYPASRFSKQFYSPKVVAAYLETGGEMDEAIRLANAGTPGRKKVKETAESDIPRIMPPLVFFELPEYRDVTVHEPSIRIKALAKAINEEPVTDIRVLVNGRPLEQSRGIKRRKRIEEHRAEIDLVIPLTQAENRISVIAANRHSQSEPEIITVRWQSRAGEPVERMDIFKPALYLLAIGVSEYQKPEYDLGVAHKDAEAVAKVFEEQRGKLYREVHKRLLTDQNATKANVLDGLSWILRESTQKDISVIFVAGHGVKDERGNYYFLPHDGDADNLFRTGVRWVEFQDVLENLPSKVILMADTCHSGSITGTRRGIGRQDSSDLIDALRELINTESGVIVMTASTGRELSLEKSEWGHGAFTKAIIEGLEGGANYDRNRTIDIKELDLFVTMRVKALTKGKQHPTTEIPKTMPNFPVVYR